jgi:uncharacterized protein
MPEILIDHDPSPSTLERLDVERWPIWTKEVSTFPWTYDESETCFILEGEVVVTPEGGQPVSFGKGDLVTFPSGLSCTWDVRRPVRKHYRFD